MKNKLTIAIAQINPHVGHIQANMDIIIHYATQAHRKGAHCVVFPECALTGYPLDDLLYHDNLFTQCQTALDTIAQAAHEIHILLGTPTQNHGKRFNTLVHCHQGEWKAIYHKQALPNYGVFDEKRHFTPGHQAGVIALNGHSLGLLVCEDIWDQAVIQSLPPFLSAVISIHASPYTTQKSQEREQHIRHCIDHTQAHLLYVNMVGGQDDVVFDGQSMAWDAKQNKILQCPAFKEALTCLTLDEDNIECAEKNPSPKRTEIENIYEALTCGVKDYVHKNGFESVIIGLSGGIDSALSAAIACDALGPQHVISVAMPSRHTARMSNEDALSQARTMGFEHRIIPIQTLFKAYQTALPTTLSKEGNITQQNLQARIRANLLMAISNEEGALLLSTSNKSEMAVGYSTLYGDMAGGFCVLKDIYKGQVYALAKYRNQISQVIPQRVIERAPSAELAPDQCDQDTLPPYPVLDAILQQAIENHASESDLIEAGFDEGVVQQVFRWILRNEYKRRQAPPGVKITSCAFGRDRRYPLTSGFGSLTKTRPNDDSKTTIN